MPALLHAMGSALAGPQLQIVWRLIAWSMLLSLVRAHGGDIVAGDVADVPWPRLVASLAALVLLLAGPRIVTLAVTALAWLWLLAAVITGDHLIADEHLLFTALPVLATISAAITRVEQRRADDATRDAALARAQRWLLRLCTLGALGFAALHKLNTDFLNPASSCATFLGDRLATRWSAPFMPLPPLAVVLAEVLVPLLLVVRPRAGALALLILAVGLGHVGPYAFNALLAALALAFIPPDAWPARPSLRATLSLVLATLAALALSAHMHAHGAWWPYLLFEATLVLAAWLTLRARDSPELRRPPLRPRMPGGPAHRAFAWLTLALLLVTGLSPYLGLKYRLSFAMLSNLRVDDDRWNSLVIPRALSPRAADPFVHVHAVHDLAGTPVKLRRGDRDGLRPALYAPQEFRRRYEHIRRRGWPAAIALRYRGVEHRFGDLRRDRELERFVAALPRERLFQEMLAVAGPQRCVH